MTFEDWWVNQPLSSTKPQTLADAFREVSERAWYAAYNAAGKAYMSLYDRCNEC
jgi:hypothetical protein